MAEELDWVAADFIPEVWIEAADEVAAFRVPTPPEVVGQVAQAAQRFRQGGEDGVCSELVHRELIIVTIESRSFSARSLIASAAMRWLHTTRWCVSDLRRKARPACNR